MKIALALTVACQLVRFYFAHTYRNFPWKFFAIARNKKPSVNVDGGKPIRFLPVPHQPDWIKGRLNELAGSVKCFRRGRFREMNLRALIKISKRPPALHLVPLKVR